MTFIDKSAAPGRRAWIERIGVSGAFFANGIAVGAWISRIPAVQQRLSLSTGRLGLILLVIALGAMSAMAISGWLSERVGDTTVVRGASILLTVSLPLIGLPHSPLTLVIVLLAFGFGSGGMDVAMNAEAVHVERRFGRSIMSSFHGLWSAGSMTGAALGSLATARGIDMFPFLAGIGAIVLVVGQISVLVMPASKSPVSEHGPVFVMPPRALIGVCVIAGCAYVSEGAIGDWNALYLIREQHIAAAIATAGFAAFSMAMAVGRFAGDWVIGKIGAEWTVRGGALMAAAAILVELIVGKPWAVFPALIIVGLSYAAIVPVAFSAAGNATGVTPSRGLAAAATAGYGGFLAGPPVIGFIAEVVHLRGAMVCVVALCLTMAIAAVSVRKPVTAPVPSRNRP